jgi:hypothetical protein
LVPDLVFLFVYLFISLVAARCGDVQKVLQTAKRMSDVVSGPGTAAVQALHPPAAVISLHLTEADLPAAPEKPAQMTSWVTCDPSDSFGEANATEHWCRSLKRGGAVPGDGTLTNFMMELQGEGWKRSIQVRLVPNHICKCIHSLSFLLCTFCKLSFLLSACSSIHFVQSKQHRDCVVLLDLNTECTCAHGCMSGQGCSLLVGSIVISVVLRAKVLVFAKPSQLKTATHCTNRRRIELIQCRRSE